ncbi:hypothetical protein PVAR5_8840 [Paecilomyces variotii No. 5]|uniref:chitin deacetylase n=1 Tax=Byssochlamys spectabilis (strain No. 5 / NBRC 109023) TaxID=1356009 RepID=V5FPW4_BYSSN|nr:hypothetical protein PVAR5_8840 [Paecilomyces variotii No. 5]
MLEILFPILLLAVPPLYLIYKPPGPLINHFQRRWPDVVWRVATPEKVVALTIDDAPSEYTDEILQILKSHNAKATFFVIGSQIAGREESLIDLIRNGNELGNHAMYDEPSRNLSDSILEGQIRTAQAMIQDIYDSAGVLEKPQQYFRPGSGFFSTRMRELLMKLGFRLVLGDVYPHDPQLPFWRINAGHILSMSQVQEFTAIVVAMALLPAINFGDPSLPTLKGRKSKKDRLDRLRRRYRMKRNANSLDPIPLDTARVTRKRDKSPHTDTRISLVKYRLEKAEALGQPFEYNETPGAKKHRPPPLNIMGPPSAPPLEDKGTSPALSRDAIARILKENKPDCPKAQAWVKAHEVSKKLTEKAKALENTSRRDMDNDCSAVETPSQSKAKEESPESNVDRVVKAHEKLQRVMFG